MDFCHFWRYNENTCESGIRQRLTDSGLSRHSPVRAQLPVPGLLLRGNYISCKI